MDTKYSKNMKIIKKYIHQLQDRGYFWGMRVKEWEMGKGEVQKEFGLSLKYFLSF